MELKHLYKFGEDTMEYSAAYSRFEVQSYQKTKGAVSLTAILSMKKGDQAWVQFVQTHYGKRSYIAGDGNPITHFIGCKIA